MDLHFQNIISDGFEINMDDIPPIAVGNQLVANIFEITFLTNLNDSMMSYGYGGGGVDIVSRSYDPNDLQSIAAAVKVACDNTVAVMQADQIVDETISANERIVSATVSSITKNADTIMVSIDIVVEALDTENENGVVNLVIPL